jgi:mono/diheme cytochrome c family protein
VRVSGLLAAGAIFSLVLFAMPVAFAQQPTDTQATQQAQPQTAAEPAQPAQAPADKPYTVQCDDQGCKVDKQTYIGWRTFHSNCHVCHAQDAVGSTFAPSLVDRLKDIDKTRFLNSVENGYKGQIGVMPAWKDNPNVNKHFEEMYSYLKARSDGALKPGRPERLP